MDGAGSLVRSVEDRLRADSAGWARITVSLRRVHFSSCVILSMSHFVAETALDALNKRKP